MKWLHVSVRNKAIFFLKDVQNTHDLFYGYATVDTPMDSWKTSWISYTSWRK